MHDLISFSVSQMILFDTPSELRYVSDGSSALTPGIAGMWKSSPTRRPVRDRYSIPITIPWNLPPVQTFLNPILWICRMQKVMHEAHRCSSDSTP